MKRWKWMTIAVVVALTVTLVWAGAASAKGVTDFHLPSRPAHWGDEVEGEDYLFGAPGMCSWGDNWQHMGINSPATLETIASTLGISFEELTDRLSQGETIAQIAQDEGIATSALVDAILAPHSEHLELRLKDGYLSEAEAADLLERARASVEEAISLPVYGLISSPYSSSLPGNGWNRWGGQMGGFGSGGSGLGLAIVKQLVEAQGGHVRVESTAGKDSTFSFCLPYAA